MDKFHQRCGRVLSLALHVESNLDLFLAIYFCGSDSLKNNLFTDKLLATPEYGLNFSQKQKLLSEICKRERVDIKELKQDLKFVTETRNKVAHYQRFWGGENTTLYPNKSEYNMNTEGLTLTDEIMKELENKSVDINSRLAKLGAEIEVSRKKRDTEWMLNSPPAA